MTVRLQSSSYIARSVGTLSVTVACGLVLLLGSVPADAALVKTFKPINKTHRALIFAPASVKRADAVAGAVVRLRKPSAKTRVRRIGVDRVRRLIDRGRKLRVKRPREARGELRLRLKPPAPTGPAGEIPTEWSRSASFESDLNSGTDYGWRADSPFVVTKTGEVGASDGSSAAKIVTNGGDSGCSCPRMTFDRLGYGPGDDVWIGGSWRVADATRLDWSRLMNLGHFEGSDSPDNWYLGLLVRDSGMEVVARRYHTDTGQSVLMRTRAIPENRWFDVDIHLRLSRTSGEALTEVFIDGELVSRSAARNMIGPGPLHFYNAGLSYFWDGNGRTTVYFDSPRVAG